MFFGKTDETFKFIFSICVMTSTHYIVAAPISSKTQIQFRGKENQSPRISRILLLSTRAHDVAYLNQFSCLLFF